MVLFRNPIVWLLRVRHRKGYGVHSPFAFSFVTDVLYNADRYYAYEEMDRTLRWWQRARVRNMRHLLFRLANYRRPTTVLLCGADDAMKMAVRHGCRGAKAIDRNSDEIAEMILLGKPDETALSYIGEGTMVVLWNLRKQRKLWRQLQEDGRVTVTFDLYDVGVAFARRDLNRQSYIINW